MTHFYKVLKGTGCPSLLSNVFVSSFGHQLFLAGWISRANNLYNGPTDGLTDWVMSFPVMKWWLMLCLPSKPQHTPTHTSSLHCTPSSQRSPMLTTSCSGWVTEWWMVFGGLCPQGLLEKGLTWRDNYTALVRATGMHCSDRGQPPANQSGLLQLGQQ